MKWEFRGLICISLRALEKKKTAWHIVNIYWLQHLIDTSVGKLAQGKSKTNCAPPILWPRPCALGLRHYVAMLIAAVLQGRQAGRAAAETSEDAGYNGQAHVGKVRNATFAYLVIWCPNIFTFKQFAYHISLFLTPAWEYIFHSVDLKWLLVAASSQWLLRGLPSCGLSVVAEQVAWSSPEEAPLCWMDVCEAAPDSEYWWRRW